MGLFHLFFHFILQVVSDESIPKLVQGLKATVQNPDSPAAQMVLINASQDILQVLDPLLPQLFLLT